MTTSKKDGTRQAGMAVFQSPTGDIIPHPVLDVPIDEEAYTRRRGLDRVVFGVTAVIAIAFLLWGFLSTSSLADVSGNALEHGDDFVISVEKDPTAD